MPLLTVSERPASRRIDVPDDAPVVIELEEISVLYRVPRQRIRSVKEFAIRVVQRQIQYDDFWAVHRVSFDVRRGELFAIVGRNGAGKSTLLKAISRVLRPTEGRVRVNGRLAPLLELGAGFHPELTGRENVFLNGALLGFSRRDIEAWFESIVAFAEIDEFIDAPLRTYSTGMVTRLGFAVATASRPDILVVDEVLSVGDQHFQQKCLNRIADFRRQGTTVLLTTHNLELVREECNRAIWIHDGQVGALGDPNVVVERYLAVAG